MMNKLNTKWLLLSVIFISSSLISCTSDLANIEFCTSIFKTYSITVLTPEGQPADSVEIAVFNKASGKKYSICNTGVFSPARCHSGKNGKYIIFHDAFDSISAVGEAIIVEGNKDNLSFRETYIFRFDGCHVRYISGADTVHLN